MIIELKSIYKMSKIKRPFLFEFLDKYKFAFFWLNWFYPKAKEVSTVYKLYHFPWQKIFRINGNVPWPVHKTSMIIGYKNISLGKDSCPGLHLGCYVQAKGGIKIGNNLRMGPNVGLVSVKPSQTNYETWQETEPIEIGNNVWIGMNSVIMPGVKIGNNVSIGAGSIVLKNIPDSSIAAGNPCEVIKKKSPYKG